VAGRSRPPPLRRVRPCRRWRSALVVRWGVGQARLSSLPPTRPWPSCFRRRHGPPGGRPGEPVPPPSAVHPFVRPPITVRSPANVVNCALRRGASAGPARGIGAFPAGRADSLARAHRASPQFAGLSGPPLPQVGVSVNSSGESQSFAPTRGRRPGASNFTHTNVQCRRES